MPSKKRVCAVVVFGLFMSVAWGAVSLNRTANVVGYADVELRPGYNLLAVPFQGIGSTNGTVGIQSAIQSAGLTGMNWITRARGDFITLWDPLLGVYEPTSHWAGATDTTPFIDYDVSNTWIDPETLTPSDIDLPLGRAFWLAVSAPSNILGTFSGEVACGDTHSVDVLPGGDMIGAPHPQETDIQEVRADDFPGFDASYAFQTTLRAWNGSGYDTYGWCADGQGTAEGEPRFDAKWVLNDFTDLASRTFNVGEGFWIFSPTNGAVTFQKPAGSSPEGTASSLAFTACIRQTNGVLLRIACPTNGYWNSLPANYAVFCKERLSDARWFYVGNVYKPGGTSLAQTLIPGAVLPLWSVELPPGSGIQPHVVTNFVNAHDRPDNWNDLYHRLAPLPGLVQTNFMHVAEGARWVPERYFFIAVVSRSSDDADGDTIWDPWEILQFGSDPENSDSDGDGMEDGWEFDNGLDPTNPSGDHGPYGDPDGDGLMNFEEYTLPNTPPYPYLVPVMQDSDGDGIPDGWETLHGQNLEEYLAQVANDNDGDGLPTPWEIANGLDPQSGVGDEGGRGDPDDDGLSNLCEWIHGTHPRLADTDVDRLDDAWEIQWQFNPLVWNDGDLDTDGDSLSDALECHYGTNPRSADTDGDGMPDAWEIAHGLDPWNLTDALADTDGDGLANLEECQGGTHPGMLDTDGDGLSDHWEHVFGLNGANARGGDGRQGDPDGDGLANWQEKILGTHPGRFDTDGDGLGDGDEVASGKRIVCWGDNYEGELDVPPGLAGVVAVSAGGWHSMALTSTGTVSCWGYAGSGATTPPPGLTNAVAICGGIEHSTALRANGTVICWGDNSFNQAPASLGVSNFVAISSRYNHGLALKANGTLFGWGYNSNGQATIPSGLTNAIAISTGSRHSLVLKSDGTVVAWGGNTKGQASVPAGLSNVVDVVAGTSHSLALRADGTVVCWGLNGDGQSTPPVGLTNVVAISAGDSHSLALRADGTVVCWGSPDYCQPAVSGNLFGVIDVGSQGYHSMSLADATGDALDPCNPDTDGDGMPDGWEVEQGLDPLDDADDVLDADDDGLTNQEEFEIGSDPHAADTDGDGLSDGEELTKGSSPLSPDGDLDGLLDWVEIAYFDTDPLDHDTDGDGVTDGQEALEGRDPTRPNAADDWDGIVVSTNLLSTKLYDGFSLPDGSGLVASNQVLFSRTFEINRHGGWEQMFLSSSAEGASGWWMYGAVLEWSDSCGASGIVDFSDQDSYRLPLSTNSPTHLTLVLRATRNEVYTGGSLHLLKWAPMINVSGAVCGTVGGAECFAVVRESEDSGVHLAFDLAGRPCSAPLSDSEKAARLNPFPDEPRLVFSPDEPVSGIDGALGGTLSAKAPGAYEMPELLIPDRPGEDSDDGVRPAWLLFVDPRMTYGDGHSGGCGGALHFDTDAASYSEAPAYPLDSRCLWNNWHRDASGAYSCSCMAEVFYGDESLEEWLDKSIENDVPGVHAIGRILLGGKLVWEGEATHHVADDCHERGAELLSSDGCGGCSSGCADGNCDDLEGDDLGSLRFRIPLGMPRDSQISGFLWFLADEPLSITPATFILLKRDDAAIADTTAGGIRTITCSDVRGRTAVIEPITSGVRITLRKTADNSLEHTWVITNVMGSASQIQLTKISRLNNIMRNVTYTCMGDGEWTRFDHIAQASEQVTREDSLDSGADGFLRETRIVRDAANVVLSHTIVESSRFGFGEQAVLRETYHATLGLKPDGELGWVEDLVEDFATFWVDDANLRRNGLPRLVWGESRPWSYQVWDAEGREILRLEQLDGSSVPPNLDGAIPPDFHEVVSWLSTLDLAATATVSDYAPLAGDSNHRDDIDSVRTESRYLVRSGEVTLIGRTWRIYTHGTDAAGRATVAVQTIRAGSQTAAIDNPGNAVSTETRYDADAAGIPLLLRGRPVTSTDEDGVTTTHAYDLGEYEPTTRLFASGGAETALRTVVSRSTAAAPDGIPGKSTQSLAIQNAAHGTTLYTATLLRSTGATLDWQANAYDDKNRLRSTLYSDGSSTTNAYSCCRLLWWTDRNGAKFVRSATTGTDHLQYAIEEVSISERTKDVHYGPLFPGFSLSHKAIIHLQDALGRETKTVTGVARNSTPGNYLPELTPSSQVSAETLYPYGTSDYRIDFDENSVMTQRTIERYVDSTVETTAVYHPTNLSSEVASEQTVSYGNGHTDRYATSEYGLVHESSFSDYTPDGCLFQISTTETSDTPILVTNSIVSQDFLGRTVLTRTPGFGRWIVSSNDYDGASMRILSSTMVSGSGSRKTLYIYDDLGDSVGSLDDVADGSTSETYYETIDSEIWKTSMNVSLSGDIAITNTMRVQLTGLSDALRSRTRSVSANGATHETFSSFTPETKFLTSITVDDAGYTNIVKSQYGRIVDTWSPSITSSSLFDGMGRTFYTTFRYPGTNLWIRDSWRAIDTLGNSWLDSLRIASGVYLDTYYDLDVWNRETLREDPLGNETETRYDSAGRVISQTGATYPVRRNYDTMGHMKSLRTTRDGSTDDETRWFFDFATGLATNKIYADGSSIVYAYTDEGQPTRTTWARGAWKENDYNALGLLSGISYSDSTPAVSYDYGAFKRVASASNSVATCRYSRDIHGMATNEAATAVGEMHIIARTSDARQRVGTLLVDGTLYAAYGYGLANRLETITNASFSAQYSYWFNRPAGYALTLPNGKVFSQTLQRDRARPELITSVTHAFDGSPIFLSAYTYDALSRSIQRLDRTSAETVTNQFAYNARSEVATAVLGNRTFGFAYDDIGSHTVSTVNSVETTYTANNLNQYSEISVPSVPSVENLSYDLDGNLLTNGVFSYTWDAENRLVAAYSNSVCVISNAYDHANRRVLKVSHGGTETRRFVYDGWNLIQETISTASGVTTNLYVWGKDLSGTLQGAGGIGGLLAVKQGNAWYFPFYDNNGNITAYVNEQGAVVAEYAYDAFGDTIAQSGTMADAFALRFSTKYYDSETGLYYYGYRFYSPELHRWMNRDPIEEEGGLNLYGFCGNDGVNGWDILGLTTAGDILDNFFSPFNTSPKLWVMPQEDPYTDIVRKWSYVKDFVDDAKRKLASSVSLWKFKRMTSTDWKPGMHYIPDPHAKRYHTDKPPKGTDPNTAMYNYFIYLITKQIHSSLGFFPIIQTEELHTSAIGRFDLTVTADEITACSATINIWMFNDMSKQSFGKYAPYFPTLPMASQIMWWNWKESFTFDHFGRLSPPAQQ